MSTQRLGAGQVVNPDFAGGTVRHQSAIISSVAPQSARVSSTISSTLPDDLYLNGVRYSIVRQIARSGEAEVFLVENNGNNFVFKYYYSQFKPKDEVLKKLKTIRHPYIIALFDYGYFRDRFYEISEYAQGGTIVEKTAITSLQKTREIVEQAVDGLHYCHHIGIIHRDIKPENIFYRTPARREIGIGDFGIASNLQDGEELVRTTMARTSLYAAPELFTNIQGKTTIDKTVDFYALGMSLLHLWFGRDPFEDVDEFGIMRLKSEGRVLFPDHINEEVEKLIKGLITVNPRERWGYDEVKRWLKGEDVKVFYQTIKFDYKPYVFGYVDGEQIVINNPVDLVFYLEKYPDKGEGHLYRNSIAKWVEAIDPGLFNELMDIVERDFPGDKSAGLTKAIYILDPERPFRGFDNTKLRTQEEIAAYFEQNFDHYKVELQNPNASFYIFLESRNYKQHANEYRNLFTITNPEAALNTLIFKLEGADKFLIGDYKIYQPEELLKVDDATMTQIIASLSNVNSKLSIWIAGFPKLQASMKIWHTLGRYDATTLAYAVQRGYLLNGAIAGNPADLYQMLKTSLHVFFPDDGNSTVRDEANYWLINYMGSSLSKLSLDYIANETCTEKEFISLVDFALTEFESSGRDLFDIIAALLPLIRNRKPDNKKAGNKIYFNNIVDIFQKSFERYWALREGKGDKFIDILDGYIDYVEANLHSYPELYPQLTIQLDPKMKEGVRNDVNAIRDNEQETYEYRAKLGKLLERFRDIKIMPPYITRYAHEDNYLKKQKQVVKNSIEKERKEKIAFTKTQFDKLLEKYKDKYRQSIKELVNERLTWYVGLSAVGLVFAVALLFDNTPPLTYLSLVILAFFGLLGFRIGNLIGSRFDKNYNDDSPIGAVVGLYVGILVGNHYKGYVVNMIPRERILNVYGFYNYVPVGYVFTLGVVMLAIFILMILFVLRKRESEVSQIKLKDAEQETLDQNMVDIDQYFIEKEVFDYFQEFVRVITLTDPDFEREYAQGRP